MKYTVEEPLSSFKFWSGGKDRADLLTSEQLDKIGEELELIDEDYSDTRINDLFWFDFEWICGLIGLKYTDDGEVVDDEEDWARTILDAYSHDAYEIYFDGFWEEDGGKANSKQELKSMFDEYVSENWLDHAEGVLAERFPGADEGYRSDFASDHWQNCKSDDWNCQRFRQWMWGPCR